VRGGSFGFGFANCYSGKNDQNELGVGIFIKNGLYIAIMRS